MTSKTHGSLCIILGSLGIVCTLIITLVGPGHDLILRAIQSI